MNNAAGNKLDYYLDRRITYSGTACQVGATRSTEVALTLTNGVRATASLPEYVVGVLGAEAKTPARRNDNKTIAGFWLAPGARVQKVLVNSRPAAFTLGTEAGRPVVLTTVTLPAGEGGPSARPAPGARDRNRSDGLAVQPLVRPATVDVTAPTCH